MKTELIVRIERLLAERLETAAQRERESFCGLQQPTDGSVVIFGAGKLGRLCARALARGGVQLRGVCDNNPALHGTMLEAAEVLSPAEAARRFGERSLFVVAIWTGTARESMAERLSWLRTLGCRHVTSYAPLVWAHGGQETPFHSFDLPSRVLAHAEAIRRLTRKLDDEESLRVLESSLRQQLLAEFDGREPRADQYFPTDLVELGVEEVVVDGGAFDGDTLETFIGRTKGKFVEYHAFEPDAANLAKLAIRVAALPSEVGERVKTHLAALHDETEELAFVSDKGTTSRISETGVVRVQGRKLDDVIAGAARVTLLKLDVEGAEANALRGAERILREHRPLVMVCVYHGPTDLWDLPLLVDSWVPGCRLYLRQHGIDGWETVCYAIPEERPMPSANRNPPAKAGRRPCPVCESLADRDVLHRQRFFEGPLGDGYDVVTCRNCGAGFADGIPSQAELDRYYAERSKYTYAYAGGAESPYDFKRFDLIADQLEPHLPDKNARILDIGCATGGLLAVLRRRGYLNVVGSDPSPACADAAQRLHGIDVRTAALAAHADWSDTFDAILLVGVLEHLRDVLPAVRIAGSLLRPGGILYCAQPDVEAFAECYNAPYQQFSTEHVNFFSGASLTCLMAGAGLRPREMWRWLVEWREGVTDSVISGAFVRSETRVEAGGDDATGLALRRYLAASGAVDRRISSRIDALVRERRPLVVWGTGALTRRLLASTALADAAIVAFVDSNADERTPSLGGRPVWTPAWLVGRTEAILVCSVTFEREIVRHITEELSLTNELILIS